MIENAALSFVSRTASASDIADALLAAADRKTATVRPFDREA